MAIDGLCESTDVRLDPRALRGGGTGGGGAWLSRFRWDDGGGGVGFAPVFPDSPEDILSSRLEVSGRVAASSEGRRSPVLVERREGGGGGAFGMDVSEDGLGSGSPSTSTEF